MTSSKEAKTQLVNTLIKVFNDSAIIHDQVAVPGMSIGEQCARMTALENPEGFLSLIARTAPQEIDVSHSLELSPEKLNDLIQQLDEFIARRDEVVSQSIAEEERRGYPILEARLIR